MSRVFFTLLVGLSLVGGLAITAYRVLHPEPVVKKSSFAPVVPVVETAPVRSSRHEAPAARATAKESPAVDERRAQLEAQFNDLKEEGRRIRQVLMESDPRAAQAYQNVVRTPEYRQLIDRRHQLEATWAETPDAERPALLAEINSLRQQGVGLVMAEIGKISSAPAPAPVTTAQRTSAGAVPANGAPAPAQAPVIFQ